MALCLSVVAWGQDDVVFTSNTEEGVEMLFSVIDEEAKTCMVGQEAETPLTAIEQTYEGPVTIPEIVEGYTVTKIANGAFRGCDLTDVTIPASINAIGDQAFACDGLNTVTFLGMYPLRITATTFYFRSDIILYVPAGCSEDFMEALYWKDFGQILEIVMEPELYVAFSEDLRTMSFRYDTKRQDYDEELTFDIPEEGEEPLWNEYAPMVNTVVFDPAFENARPHTTASWFEGMEYLSLILGMENLNTSEVTTMTAMFQGCKALRNIELRYMNTVVVEQMDYMFNNCASLKIVDLSSFNTSYNTTFYRMFNGCSSLESVTMGNLIDTRNVESFSFMFAGCSKLIELNLSEFNISERAASLDMLSGCTEMKTLVISASMGRLDNMACQGVGTEENPCAVVAPEDFDFGVDASGASFPWKSGWFFIGTPAPYAVYDNQVLTFYYDNMKKARDGAIFEINAWDEICVTSTKSVVFDKSFAAYRPTSTSRWFQGMTKLSSIVALEYLNTELVRDMDYMFYDCSMLTDLDLSHFDTRNVGGVTQTFSDEGEGDDGMSLNTVYQCEGYGMRGMFYGCTNLVNLNLSSFNTSKVRSMNAMFKGCENLLAVDVSAFNTSMVADMARMFEGCAKLETLDLSSFDLGQVGKNPMGEQYEEDYVETVTHENADGETFVEYRSFTFVPGSSNLMLGGCASLDELRMSMTMELLEEDACQGVGSENEPCVIYVPEQFVFEGVEDTENVFLWKSGVFCMGVRKATLTIAEVKVTQGAKADAVVSLYNKGNAFNAFQFDITLPEGLDLAKENRSYVYWLTDRYSKNGCTVMINPLTENTYRIALYSLNDVSITGTEGPIMILRLQAEDNVGDQVLEGSVDNIVFNGDKNVSYYVDPASFEVVTNSYLLGDVDHSGTVNVSDVVSLVNYIVGVTPYPFFVENADMNDDRVKNISDVMSIVGLVIRGNPLSAPRNSTDALKPADALNPADTLNPADALKPARIPSPFKIL